MSAPSSDTAGIRQVIRALRAAGYTLTRVHDGGESLTVRTEGEAIDAITAVDAATLYVLDPARRESGYVYFVLGNDPAEVAADWTVNLSGVIDPLTDSWWD